MTYGKRQFESLDSIMRETIPPLYNVTQKLLNGIDADTAAFNSYMVRQYTMRGHNRHFGIIM